MVNLTALLVTIIMLKSGELAFNTPLSAMVLLGSWRLAEAHGAETLYDLSPAEANGVSHQRHTALQTLLSVLRSP